MTSSPQSTADFVFVSHAHFDHLCGVAPIARSTGATVVASPESARILRQDDVPEDQILMVTGGETVRCGPAASVSVLPALHSCLFAASDGDSAVECLGDLGISAQDRRSKLQGVFAGGFAWAAAPLAGAMKNMLDRSSINDGGQLAYLLRTGDGSVLFSGSAGYWPGIFAGLRPDVAFLALAGRTCPVSPTRDPRPASCWSRRRPRARERCASAITTPCCPGYREPTSPRRPPCLRPASPEATSGSNTRRPGPSSPRAGVGRTWRSPARRRAAMLWAPAI
jgi:L-ascorbate metabolism protein UlaG (beta-lactamase superfamily)